MSAPVQSLQPDIDLVQDLRMDADMLKDGHQQNLTKLWHSDVVKQAALNALKAANTIEQYRADQTRDESVIATLKARAEQAERAVDVLKAALREADKKLKEVIHYAKGNAKAAKIDDDEKTWLAHAKEVERASKSIRAALESKP